MQAVPETRHLTEIDLIAGPAAASPPLFIAAMLVALSIAGPFIFVADGTPSLLLGITAVTVALAGMVTLVAAVRSQVKRRADAALRRRVSISDAGITFYPTADTATDRHFAWNDIIGAQLAQTAFFVQAKAQIEARVEAQAGGGSAKPARHAIRFGKLVTPRSDIISVLQQYLSRLPEPL